MRSSTSGAPSLSFALFLVTFALCAGSSRDASAGKPRPAPAPAASAAPTGEAEEEADPSAPPLPDLHFTEGPKAIDLGHSLTLALPASDRFLGSEDADKVLRKMGNLHNEDVIGLVAPKDDAADWFAVVEWVDEGHVSDEEPIDAKKLLEQMSDAQKEANPERVKEGFKALTIDGFQVDPAYDKSKHHFSWALIVSDSDGKSVNFNTRILGRTSFASIDLVTDPTKLETFRGDAMSLLDATTFAKGQRYDDFDSKKDKLADYGLAGLIAGVSAWGRSSSPRSG